MRYGLFAYNASRCEKAKHPKCNCVCGGALHGKSHADKMPDLWAAYIEREEREQAVAAGDADQQRGTTP